MTFNIGYPGYGKGTETPVWSAIIRATQAEVSATAQPLTPTEIYRRLVARAVVAEAVADYNRVKHCLQKAIADGRISSERIAHRSGHPAKFKVGDKVRINKARLSRAREWVPKWFSQLRLDNSRTITAIYSRGSGRHARYYLGVNNIGVADILEKRPFYSFELIPYVKNSKVGRPRTKRQYRKRTPDNRPAVLSDSPTTNRPEPCTAMVVFQNAPSISYVNQL